MVDIFKEVEEDLRYDQARKLWERYKVHLLAGLILFLTSVIFWKIYEARTLRYSGEMSNLYENALRLENNQKVTEVLPLLEDLSKSSHKGYSVLSQFHLAGEEALKNKDIALKRYQSIAQTAQFDSLWRELAQIKIALLQMDHIEYEEMKNLIMTSSEDTRPFRSSAREILALSALKAKKNDEAIYWLTKISQDQQAPYDISKRSSFLIDLIKKKINSPEDLEKKTKQAP